MTHPTDDRNFRLPLHVRPTSYDAMLSVDLDGRRFAGTIRIDLELVEPTEEIVVHGIELDVARARLRVAGGDVDPVAVVPAPKSETIVVRFAAPVPRGPAALELGWAGRMTDGLRGLYPAGDGLAATQFEAADARRVFPCFDEPGFKAPWKLAVEAPQGVVVLSNGAPVSEEDLGGRRRVRFAETPPLPTYLVALVLDQVGLPEFEAGAMENAGLVTYREVALLLDPQTASLAQKKRVAEVVTHELAHQWFGNWVTMTWWDDLWLNEAFATWMAFKIVDQWNPAWRVWLEFDQGKAGALHLDALRSTHPVRAEIRNVAEAGEAFDLITYEKGGAVLRMIEGYLGEERFRDGIRRYMRRHAKRNAVADDLWRALGEASSEPVVELANAWIGAPGYPVVSVERRGRVLRLEQRRFLSDPAAAAAGAAGREEVWPVPLVVRIADGERVSEQRFLVREPRAELVLAGSGEPDFVVANAGATGFYRVAYDEEGLAALVRNLPRLATAERIALLSDEWALVRAGVREVGSFLDLCASFVREEDHAVLDELVARLAVIEHRLVADDDRAALQSFVAAVFAPQLAATGWDAAPNEADTTRLRRAAAVRGLGLVARDRPAIVEACGRLDRWLGGERAALEPNLHDAAVTMAARSGDTSRFDAFRALFRKENDPAFRRRWLLALASFEDAQLAARGIDLAFGDEVPLQDTASFAAALFGNRTAREPFWTRLRADWDRMHARLHAAPMLRRHLVEAEGFLAAHPMEEARQASAQTLERLRQDVALRERTQRAIGSWLARRAPGRGKT